jgi:hypothetical protein
MKFTTLITIAITCSILFQSTSIKLRTTSHGGSCILTVGPSMEAYCAENINCDKPVRGKFNSAPCSKFDNNFTFKEEKDSFTLTFKGYEKTGGKEGHPVKCITKYNNNSYCNNVTVRMCDYMRGSNVMDGEDCSKDSLKRKPLKIVEGDKLLTITNK